MAVLTKNEIIKAINNKIISVDPFNEEHVGPGSIDLTLGNKFRIFKKQKEVYHITNESDFHDITEEIVVEDNDYITISPGEMILGITKEKIMLPDNMCGRLEGRSRFARFGLAVHVTAGFMHPGIANQQVLEMVNFGNTPLALYPGTLICQFIFEECRGQASYQGRFSEQDKP